MIGQSYQEWVISLFFINLHYNLLQVICFPINLMDKEWSNLKHISLSL